MSSLQGGWYQDGLKVLAIDYGSRRIGLALGDTRLGIAVPLESVENKGDRTLYVLSERIKELGVHTVVVGLPLTPSGKEGQRTKQVREFTERLKPYLPEGVELLFWDERYTTIEAYSLMEGLKASRKKKLKDSLSAYVILLEYMESL